MENSCSLNVNIYYNQAHESKTKKLTGYITID